MTRTIFVGDIHGCLEEFKHLEKELKISSKDKVIILGDLINRGPFPVQTIKYIYEAGYACVCGNHDLKYRLAYDKNGGFYNEIYKSLSKKNHDWYMNLPFYLESKEYIAVHAGLEPEKPPSKTDKNILTRIRTWDGLGKDLNDERNPPWYTFYKGEKKVFYGHWAFQGLTIRENTIGLDSGCVYGKELSACILETMEIVQVKSKKVHYQY